MWPSASTRPVVLVGDPVIHSLSPAIHNAAFRELGLDLVYLACRVQTQDVRAALSGLLVVGAAGVNVTLPHKPAAAALASRLTESASATGVANTLVPEAGGWLGANTDVEAFVDSLRNGPSFEPGEFVVLGAGGAARSVSYALLTAFAPTRLTIAGRDASRSSALARELARFDSKGVFHAVDLSSASESVRRSSLVVNATSVGMAPQSNESPWTRLDDFRPEQLVFDLVYTPAPTRLLRDAASRGARVLDGRDMLLRQAAAAFRLWTGREFPMAIARDALDRGLSS